MSSIKTKADYLKLIGFEVEIDTKDSKSYRGNVKDLSDNCEYLILLKVYNNRLIKRISFFTKNEYKIPLKEIDLIQVIDRKQIGELQINGDEAK